MGAYLICSYIYQSFLVVKSALDVYIPLAKNLLKTIDTFFTSCITVIFSVWGLAIQAMVDEYRILQKTIVDYLLGGSQKLFCLNLFKCNIFMKQILNPNSLICRNMIRKEIIEKNQVEYLSDIANDFNAFTDNVCKNGFTFEVGMSCINDLVKKFLSQLEYYKKKIIRKKDEIRRMLDDYINKIIDLGIMDLLDKLKLYFECVIDENASSCANNRTARSFYEDCLEKLCIEENSDGYGLENETANKMLKKFDAQITKINNIVSDMKKGINDTIDGKKLKAANKAFNLSQNIFPGGMNWTDVKHFRMSKNVAYSYFKIKRRQFIRNFLDKDQETLEENLKIKEDNGFIKISFDDEEIKIDTSNTDDLEKYGLEEQENDTKYQNISYPENLNSSDVYYDETSDSYYSVLSTALEILNNPDGKIAKDVKESVEKLKQFKESDLVKEW